MSIFTYRKQTHREEIANGITHGIGLIAAIAATPFVIKVAINNGEVSGIVGVSIFALSMIFVYLTSTLYHSFPFGKIKDKIRVIDHGAIYILIAGTYTPFTLGVLNGPIGWTLFGLEWALALVGVSLNLLTGVKHKKIERFLYLLMGWLLIIAIKPIWITIPKWGLVWILAGGLAYTLGVPFYAAKQIKYTHFVWHLFVIAGTVCHFIAVMFYSAKI
ncbi:MAG: hemolysin III family protein [Candidatus Dadabacteria bacterium]|nr:hemolysin III family protein [Candidatus Dadabacteria bacterium]NIQ15653.1 hemolysin III family protein [Candidatus Dadabacteria bacterium]